jgi:hypothetical protein
VAARPEEAAHLLSKLAQIIEPYDETPVGLIRHNKSIQNRGMALVSAKFCFSFLLTIINQKLLSAFRHNNNPG